MNAQTPRLYSDLAWLWPLWGDPGEYAPWCDCVTQMVRRYSKIEARSLPDPTDTSHEAAIIYLIREDGRLRVESDIHIMGLFPHSVWREGLADAGFEVHEESYEDEAVHPVFVCVKG